MSSPSLSEYKHIAPRMSFSTRLFLKDETGQLVKWKDELTDKQIYTTPIPYSDDGMTATIVSATNTCRETVIDSLYWRLVAKQDKAGRVRRELDLSRVTAVPPAGLGLPEDFELRIHNKYYLHAYAPGKPSADLYPMYAAVSELYSSAKAQTKLFQLLDCLVGSTAMLLWGPRAYRRFTKNPIAEGKDPAHFSPTDSAEVILKYDGLNSIVATRSQSLSILLGMARLAYSFFCNGFFEEFENVLCIPEVRARLRTLKTQDNLSAEDEEYLKALLMKLRPYYTNKVVQDNPGAYPLNEYTEGIFFQYLKENKEAGLTDLRNWQVGVSPGPYITSNQLGFLQWAYLNKEKDKKFNEILEKRDRTWSGTASTVYYI